MSRDSPPPPYTPARGPAVRLTADGQGDFVLSGDDVRTFIECSRNLRGLMAGREDQMRALEMERTDLAMRLNRAELQRRMAVAEKDHVIEQLRGELERTKGRLTVTEKKLNLLQSRENRESLRTGDDSVVSSLCSLLSKTNINDEEVVATLAPKPEWRGQNLIAAYGLTLLAMFVLCLFLRFGFGSVGMFQHPPGNRYGPFGPHNFAR